MIERRYAQRNHDHLQSKILTFTECIGGWADNGNICPSIRFGKFFMKKPFLHKNIWIRGKVFKKVFIQCSERYSEVNVGKFRKNPKEFPKYSCGSESSALHNNMHGLKHGRSESLCMKWMLCFVFQENWINPLSYWLSWRPEICCSTRKSNKDFFCKPTNHPIRHARNSVGFMSIERNPLKPSTNSNRKCDSTSFTEYDIWWGLFQYFPSSKTSKQEWEWLKQCLIRKMSPEFHSGNSEEINPVFLCLFFIHTTLLPYPNRFHIWSVSKGLTKNNYRKNMASRSSSNTSNFTHSKVNISPI